MHDMDMMWYWICCHRGVFVCFCLSGGVVLPVQRTDHQSNQRRFMTPKGTDVFLWLMSLSFLFCRCVFCFAIVFSDLLLCFFDLLLCFLICCCGRVALTTRHLSGFLWGPPTQDTGRCCSRCLFGVSGWWYSPSWWYKLPWQWLLLECVCWWLVYPGCHNCSCTTGVQPHPARVQSVWLRPGEAVKPAINSTHSTYTLHSCVFWCAIVICTSGPPYIYNVCIQESPL